MHPHDSRPPPGINGHTFEIARALGELGAESRRHTELLLQQQQMLFHLPDRLAAAVARQASTPPAPPPTPPRGLAERLGSLRDWMVAAAAVGALVAAIVGRFPWSEIPDLLARLPR